MTVQLSDNTVTKSRVINKNMGMDELEAKFKESSFKVNGFYMVVIPVPVNETTEGGLYIPDKTQDDMSMLFTLGKVVQMGPECFDRKVEAGKEPWCQEGDYIVFHKFKGSRLEINGITIIVLSDDCPLGVINDPEEISKDYLTNQQKSE